MRVTRLEKYRRKRGKSIKRTVLFFVVIPAVTIAAGYVISSLIIIPVMTR